MGFEIHSYFQPLGNSPLCISVCLCERERDRNRHANAGYVKCASMCLGVTARLACVLNLCDCVHICVYVRVCLCMCLSWQGVLLLWGEADGLCGSQPTELVGSSSDIPSCHADTRSQPIFAEIVSQLTILWLAPLCRNRFYTKSALDLACDSVRSFLCTLLPDCVIVFNVDNDPRLSVPAKSTLRSCHRDCNAGVHRFSLGAAVHSCCLPRLRVSELVIGFLESSYSLQ